MIYNRSNFHKHTYCEFEEVSFDFSNLKTYISKSGSVYHYVAEGVYRYSNHWGRVANCRWKIRGVKKYKNQLWYTAFSKWSAFYDLQSTKECCSLEVIQNKVKLCFDIDNTSEKIFSLQLALKRKKEIESMLKTPSFLKYYNKPEQIKLYIIEELIQSSKSLHQIKLEVKDL